MLYFLKIIKIIKKIFTIIILFQRSSKPKKLLLKNVKYNKIHNNNELIKIKFNNFIVPEEFTKRVNNRQILHYLYQNKSLIVYGWSSKNRNFSITEIDCKIINNKNIIFFDFFTMVSFRKKGFYQLLLKKMLINFKFSNCYIYTTLFNVKSFKAIIKSNFKFNNFYTILKKKINLN